MAGLASLARQDALTASGEQMPFNNVAILGLECVDAPHVVTSASMMEAVGESFERLGMRTDLLEGVAGIKARRFWDPETQPSDAAALAAQKGEQNAFGSILQAQDYSKLHFEVSVTLERVFKENFVRDAGEVGAAGSNESKYAKNVVTTDSMNKVD